MNLMSDHGSAQYSLSRLQESLANLKQFLIESITQLNSSSSSSSSVSSVKPIFETIQFDSASAGGGSGDTISKTLTGSVVISKEFIQNNRKQILSML